MILIVSRKRLEEVFNLWGLEAYKDKRSSDIKVGTFIHQDYGKECVNDFLRILKRGGGKDGGR